VAALPFAGRLSRLICTTLVLALVVVLGSREASATTEGVPDSMAAMGDSITRAFDADSGMFGDQSENSWSTGTSATVQGHYFRILQSNPAINGKNNNMAVSGATMSDLNGQAINVNAIPGGVEYMTILMGANDVCTSSEATMTPVATFRSQFVTGMNTLTAGTPNARIFLLSIPSVYRLWEVLHTNGSAVLTWGFASICQSLLQNAQSMEQADVDRRARVRQRNIDFNTQLAEVCALYPRCKFDNNAAFNYPFVPSQISTIDYFHPSLDGQIVLATESWKLFDMDQDGWRSGAETTIGTNALDDCPDNATSAAWPPDFNNDDSVTGADLSAVAADIGKSVPPAAVRRDIAPDPPDGAITGADLSAVAGVIGRSCTP